MTHSLNLWSRNTTVSLQTFPTTVMDLVQKCIMSYLKMKKQFRTSCRLATGEATNIFIYSMVLLFFFMSPSCWYSVTAANFLLELFKSFWEQSKSGLRSPFPWSHSRKSTSQVFWSKSRVKSWVLYISWNKLKPRLMYFRPNFKTFNFLDRSKGRPGSFTSIKGVQVKFQVLKPCINLRLESLNWFETNPRQVLLSNCHVKSHVYEPKRLFIKPNLKYFGLGHKSSLTWAKSWSKPSQLFWFKC